jgi:hypothetical protein
MEAAKPKMRITREYGQLLAIWFVASVIAVVSCMLNIREARMGNEYLPMGNDSFYHAARILETAKDPASFYEFDPKIHAPEGSILVWPWGYDYLMAKVVRFTLASGLSTDPLHALLWIPVCGVIVAVGLLIVVARRLGLSNWLVTLAALCLALSPTTQLLFGYGEIDHHYAELLFVFASLAAGLGWFRSPNVLAGIALGAVFGASLAVHNGLFILQLPFLATLLIRWVQGKRTPIKPVIALVATLVCTALAALLPSLPFRLGRFEFYTLSWFHLYVVCCTGIFTVLLTQLEQTHRSLLALIGLAALLLMPLLNEIRLAQAFLAGSLGMLGLILEMRSPVQLAFGGNADVVSTFYSLLIWLTPVTLIVCATQVWRERASPNLLFWIACLAGLLLMSMQMRMHYFGNHALYLPWLVLAQGYVVQCPRLRNRILLVTTLLLLLAYVPQIRHALIARIPRAGDPWFEKLHPIFPSLAAECARDPGVVLADTNAGHYIRYYSQCSVIANNFLLTPQHFRKVDEIDRLFAGSAEQLRELAPYVKYVLVRPGDIKPSNDGNFTYSFFGGAGLPKLTQRLLFSQPQDVPDHFRLLAKHDIELRDAKVSSVPYARLYKIESLGHLASSDGVIK